MDNPFDRFALRDLAGRRTLKWQAYPPDVLPLWVAEMDTDLAEPVRAAVITAVQRSEVGYPWGRTYPDALASFAEDTWGWSVDPATMRHTTDVMTGMANAIRLVASAEAVLVITTPVYPPFLDLPAVTGLPVRYATLSQDGRLDTAVLAGALAAIRAEQAQPVLVLANPHNPTGVAHTRAELELVAGLAAEYGARVVVDEIHAPLVLAGATFTPYLSVPGAEQAYAVHSASKAFNLPGLKAALVVPGTAAVDEITAGLPQTLDHSASWIGVLAHSVALTEGRDWLTGHLAGLAANRTLLGSLLVDRLPGIRWRPPEATYLAWLDCRDLGLTEDPAERFLSRGRVALNSGTSFGPGGEGHVRLNFATGTTVIAEAVERIRGSLAD